MRVAELVELLQKLPRTADVILQKDSEGNGYSPLSSVDGNAVYLPESTWHGEVLSTDWSAEDAGMSEDEWAKLKCQPRCVVLCPVN